MAKGTSSEALIVAVFVCCVAFIECSTSCEEGWEHFAGSCYLFESESTTPFRARQLCQATNASLVEIRSPEENTFIARLTGGTGHWIGLHRTPAMWTWDASGIPLTQDSFSNWRIGRPVNNGQWQCAVFAYPSGQWFDGPCARTLPSVCKRLKVSASCERGWREHGEYCYLSVHERRTRDEAEQHCASQSASLADVNTLEENAFIRAFMTPTRLAHWIGLRRRPARWVWNTDDTEIDYENWAADADPGRVDGTNHCAEISLGGKWKTSQCYARRPYICKNNLGMCERLPYGPCSQTCGQGTKSRTLICNRGDTSQLIFETVPCKDLPPCSF